MRPSDLEVVSIAANRSAKRHGIWLRATVKKSPAREATCEEELQRFASVEESVLSEMSNSLNHFSSFNAVNLVVYWFTAARAMKTTSLKMDRFP